MANTPQTKLKMARMLMARYVGNSFSIAEPGNSGSILEGAGFLIGRHG